MAQYILNMGGEGSDQHVVNTVDVFEVTDSGVTRRTDLNLTLSVARESVAAASCGNYILAMGGYDSGTRINTVDIFQVTASGVEKVTPSTPLTLSVARSSLAAASVGNYILAMGGYGSGLSDAVDIFHVTASGVEKVTPSTPLTLSVARSNVAAASCGNYILAMGGYANNDVSNTVDVFEVTDTGIVNRTTDFNLTLSSGRGNLAAASFGNYILAMGGAGGVGNVSNAVDVFEVTDTGIVNRTTDFNLTLSSGRDNLAAASVGNYILAMGGRGSGSGGISKVVDVFEVTNSGVVHRTDLNLTLSVGRYYLAAASCGNFVLAMAGASSDAVDVFQLFE